MLSQDMYLCFELHARRCVCAAKDLRCVRCALAKQKTKIFARFTALADPTRQLLTLASQCPHIALDSARNTSDKHNLQGSPIERPEILARSIFLLQTVIPDLIGCVVGIRDGHYCHVGPLAD